MTDGEVRELVSAIAAGARAERRADGGWRLALGDALAFVAGCQASPEAQRRALEDGAHGLRLMLAGRAREAAEREWRASVEQRLSALEAKERP